MQSDPAREPPQTVSSLSKLSSMVHALGCDCPWTKAQRTDDMIFWARKELIEVEEVLRTSRGAGGMASGPRPINNSELIKELGDVLFDTLMMIQVASAEFPDSGVSLEACAASACAKVKRRCPYIFDKNSRGASSVADAEAAWQAAKQRERDAENAAGSGLSAPPEQSSADGAADGLSADVGDDGGLSEWMVDFKLNTGPQEIDDDDDDEDEDQDDDDGDDAETTDATRSHSSTSKLPAPEAAARVKPMTQAAPSSSASPPAASPSTTPPRVFSMEAPTTGYLSEAEEGPDGDDDDEGGLREWMRDYQHGQGPPSEESCSEDDA